MSPVENWFKQIYARYQERLLSTAVRILGDEPLAEDLVQNVFVILLIHYEELKGHPNIWGWLKRTLRNQIMNELHKASHTCEVPLTFQNEPVAEDPYAPDFLEAMPPGLSDSEKLMLYLHCEVGLTHEEIAAGIGCSPDACRMRLSRARAHGKKLMKNSSG